MPKFFVDEVSSEIITLDGEQARHISKSLRMKKGEEVVLCDGKGTDYACVIEDICDDLVTLKLAFTTDTQSESNIKIALYQGVPKGDKLANVVQKCTELGVCSFHPVTMARSISRPDEKSAEKKVKRLNKIACEAAKQSRRGIVPEVFPFEDYSSAISKIEAQKIILFYEKGGENLKDILCRFKKGNITEIAVIIGPEGGFEEAEVDFASERGAVIASLGKRILRTETAPIAAAANIIYELESR